MLDNWNWGLANACEGGYKELVELMIIKGALSWNWSLSTACRNGHKEIAKLLIVKGATRCFCNQSIVKH